MPQVKPTAPQGEEINLHRESIDRIDQRIMELINIRAQHALEIAQHKAASDKPFFAPHRERAVLNQLRQGNRGPLPDEGIEAVFTEIISACRGLQTRLRAAFLGPEFSFSHQAALHSFGNTCFMSPLATVADVFAEVEGGHSQVGLVPVENSSQGGVGATFDLFVDSDLSVCGEVYAKISQVLMSAEADCKGIKEVYSHPQALSQCAQWLRRNLPWAELREDSSTAAAARRASEQPHTAAVGSELAAQNYGLKTLARDIQDGAHNVTRFLVLSKQACPPTGEDKTSLLFVTKHKPGTLYQALGILAQKGLNLTFIESRPTRNRPWEYTFFVDIEGHRDDPEVGGALKALGEEVQFLKILGSYPAGREP
ncbi:MAG: prephenate dehydratase [Desulfarculaceae bacterium]